MIRATEMILTAPKFLRNPLDKTPDVHYHARQSIKGIGTKGNEAV
jgi:hypothetical protein